MHLAMRPTPCMTGQVHLLVLYILYIYYIKLKSRLSVRLSDRHADSSVVCACIDVGLGLCRAVVFGM